MCARLGRCTNVFKFTLSNRRRNIWWTILQHMCLNCTSPAQTYVRVVYTWNFRCKKTKEDTGRAGGSVLFYLSETTSMISANTILVNLEYFIGYHSGLLDIDPQITMNNSNETHEGLLPPALLVMYVLTSHPLHNLQHFTVFTLKGRLLQMKLFSVSLQNWL